MASRRGPNTPFAGEPDKYLDESQRKKSVLVINVPLGTKEEDLIIYFQKESNGGGEVEDAKMLEDGKAVVIFDEDEVASRVLKRKHPFNGTLLQLEPCFKFIDDSEVFSLVSAKLDSSRFTVDLKELNELLVKAQEETGVKFIETCEGFLVSGTLEQIDKSCLFLSRYAKRATPVTESPDNLQNVHRNDHPLSYSDDEAKALDKMVLDVEPKLMYILGIKVNEIEKKFKMKIDWKSEPGKALLSPNGKDAGSFEQGKEEFITLYQKEFQDLQEKDFPLDAVKSIEDIDSTATELMKKFSVIIDKKDDKNVHIFGKENDVAQVMQQLQGKFGKRRARKPYKASSNGELPMPDTYAQSTILPLSKTLDNGVMVSVHQGDITKVQVHVIVNAANERLDHGGGVAGAIVKQGGRKIQQESDALVRRYGCVPVGQVAYTGPGNLPYKHIFHAVGPQWRVHGEERSREFIFEACMNSFLMASKYKISSIALPGISSGLYGVPKQVCAEMMFAAAETFAADASSDNQLKDIRFVNIDTPTYEAFRREFHNRYSLMTKEETDLESNPKDEDALYLSPQAEKEREYKRNTNKQMFGSTGRTDQEDNVEELQRKKRAAAADAAARRMEQGKKNETEIVGEIPRGHETLSKIPSGKDADESGFVKGFNENEKKYSQGTKHDREPHPRNENEPKGKEQNNTLITQKKGQRMEEKRKEKAKHKGEEEEEGQGKVKEEEKKQEKEKEKEKEMEKEKEKKKEKEMEKEKEKEEEEEKEKENEKEKEEKAIGKQSVEGKDENYVISMFAKMGINDDKPKREDAAKTETNEINNSEIVETKEKDKTDKTKSMYETENEDSDGKKVDPEIPYETDECSRLKERPCEQSYSEINNKLSLGDGRKASDRELSGRGVKKTYKLCGRGRGALAFTPTLTDTMPGRAVRQDPSNVNGDSRTDEDDPSGDRKVAPGLKVSDEGLKFANTIRKRSEERKLSHEEDSVNARKKHLEISEPKDTIDGVPPKKAKVDERTEEKKGGGSAKLGDTMTNVNEKYEGLSNAKSERDDDKEQVKEEIKTDVSGSDESCVSNSNKENNEHDIVDKSGNVCDQEKEEIKSEVDHLNNTQTEKISGMHAEKEEESSATSGGKTDSKKPMDSKFTSDGDGQSLDNYAKQEINGVPEKATGSKPLDPNVEGNGDDQNSQKDSKVDSSVASFTKANDPKKQVDFNVDDNDNDRSSHKDSRDERSVPTAEATEHKTTTDSNVEENGDDQNSHKDSKDGSSVVSEEATQPNNPLDPNVKRGSESQAPDLEAKDNSKDVSSEAADPKKPLERDGDGESSDKKAEEKSNTGSSGSADPNKPLKRDGDVESSNKEAEEKSNTESSEAADPSKPLKRDGDVESSNKEAEEKSNTESSEAADPSKPLKRDGDVESSNKEAEEKSNTESSEAADPNKPLKRDGDVESSNKEAEEKSNTESSEAADPNKPLKRDGDVESSIKEAEDKSNTESAEAIDSNNISNGSAEPESMNSFVLLDMPSVDHDNLIRHEKTSGSSDESSESIELLNLPERDEFSDTSSSSPVIEQGSDLAQVNPVSDSHTKATENTVGSAVTDNKDQSVENNATELEGEAGSSSIHQEADNTESIIKDNDHFKKISSIEDLSHDNVATDAVKKENSDKETTSAKSNKKQECGFCFSTLDSAQLLRICDSGHAVCRKCFDNLQNADRNSVCPTCHEVVPRIALQPPNGQMKSGIVEKGLEGYESCDTIYVDYEFPEGTQGVFHPNPGTPYDKLSRRTFLPDNEEGREVLDLLKKAFDASILFTVGKSTINDKDNQIIFNADIEHKTNVNGGPKVSGYPDPEYFDRVKKQLKSKGIE